MTHRRPSTTSRPRKVAIHELDDFLRRLNMVIARNETPSAATFIDRWQAFKPKLAELLKAAAAKEQKTASKHNLFRVLQIEYDEEHTHSRLLADFLNPQGLHGQGLLFLAAFLSHCHEAHGLPLPAGEIASARWHVQTERDTQFGRIDIIVSCRDLRYLLAIENKILSGEQDNQLKRYHLWLKNQSLFYDHRSLLFLTPDGRLPTSHGGCECFCLSYRNDVSEILRASLKRIKAESLRVTIKQYLEIIESLVPKTEVGHED